MVPNKELLDPADQALLVDLVPVKKGDKLVGSVPWLRRTEYISTERNVYGRNSKAGFESKIGMSAMKEEKLQKLLDLSVEGQIQYINQSFEAANKALVSTMKHPKKPDLQAQEIFPIFPDFEFWSNPYFITSFDSDPISDNLKYNAPENRQVAKEEALLKPQSVSGPYGDKSWVSYYAPSLNTMEKLNMKRKAEMQGQHIAFEDEAMEHLFQRDLDINVVPSAYPFFLELRKEEGGAFYNSIQYNMKLKKRRLLNHDDVLDEAEIVRPTRVLVKQRDLGEVEKEERKAKMSELLQREVEDDDF